MWLLPGMWKQNLKTILPVALVESGYGLIQEAASNQNVVVHCRERTVAWDSLCSVIMHSQASKYLDVPVDLCRFVSRIQQLRTSAPDPAYGLLSLTHEFRHSEASDSRDKLYALKGLVKTDHHNLDVAVDYKKKEYDVWTDFAKVCIEKYRNLLVLATIDERGHTPWDSPRSDWSSYWVTTWGKTQGRTSAFMDWG